MIQQKSLGQMLFVALILVPVLVTVIKTKGQEGTSSRSRDADAAATEQWEYLVVAGPSSTNFSPTGNPRMAKAPQGLFGREAFVLEQHLDKLGASGWELVSVAGTAADPAFFFKRRK